MKILDRYIAKNFLIGYVIAFCVLIGLRILIDLFVNLDEFAELTDSGTTTVVKSVLTFYALNITLYFRDFAGMIMVVAAAFSLGRMIRSNELVAVMASGVSLKRLIMPIIFLSIMLTGLLVIDQELLIPPFSDKLVRSHDDIPGREIYNVRYIADARGSRIRAQKFDVETATFYYPTILTREKIEKNNTITWNVTGRIDADKAIYNTQTGKWDLINGRHTEKNPQKGTQIITEYVTDLTARDIPVRCKSGHLSLLSWRQLRTLASQRTKIKDMAQLYSQMHSHVTEPIINLIMLMISLPILVCRDPKTMKFSVVISFALTGACLVTNFLCKIFATEIVFGNQIIPQMWAWLPIIILFYATQI